MTDQDGVALADMRPDALWDDWDSSLRVPDTPELHLDGFDSSLDLLLDLAERERIELSRILVIGMTDQFLAAMARYERHVKLERRADWLVLATRLLLLRSRLLLPSTPGIAGAARDEAERELSRLQSLQVIRAAAGGWTRAPSSDGTSSRHQDASVTRAWRFTCS